MITIGEITDYIATICPIISINSNGVIDFDPSATQPQKDQANQIMDDWLIGVYPASVVASNTYRGKWEQIDLYESNLTVTIGQNKYAANKEARLNMKEAISQLGSTGTDTWREEWGSFQTNSVELQNAIDTALAKLTDYRNLIFGA